MALVLVLDDDAAIRNTLQMLFEDEGHTIVTYAKGSDALEYLRHQDTPHVIFTDYLMPEMMGDEFLRRAQQESHTLQHHFILFAARSLARMPEELVGFLQENHIPYIHKPFTIDEILTQVAASNP
ncbi:MAG: response regulator [Ktedonobacteraceae bacterium]|nr:response regulator [Ktedonobacteraceae bacterium]MBA3826188.1 response regulator [Ktedonobacterales bacterium]